MFFKNYVSRKALCFDIANNFSVMREFFEFTYNQQQTDKLDLLFDLETLLETILIIGFLSATQLATAVSRQQKIAMVLYLSTSLIKNLMWRKTNNSLLKTFIKFSEASQLCQCVDGVRSLPGVSCFRFLWFSYFYYYLKSIELISLTKWNNLSISH